MVDLPQAVDWRDNVITYANLTRLVMPGISLGSGKKPGVCSARRKGGIANCPQPINVQSVTNSITLQNGQKHRADRHRNVTKIMETGTISYIQNYKYEQPYAVLDRLIRGMLRKITF